MQPDSVLWRPQSEAIPFVVRKAIPEDIPFITNSWLKSYRGAQDVKFIPNNQYFFFQHRLIEQIIPRSVVLVAADKNDLNRIMGWVCAEVVDTAVLLHYVYVKNSCRGMGLGSGLLRFIEEYEQPPVIITTHYMPPLERLMASREGKWFHNRFLAFVNLPDKWSD